ncbi:hypothetical protein PAPYR_5452 [Paratrimastix pyriformis]|uniref:Uncharacterized protein n=1 Tax=Paratrimastix pyriformis TaxID=342808 RepID=A0ABQ8UMJ7_9EUKA|nr:hypothetical protein PAPYR_5452 [Paratrimastix pyriformis]
MQVLFLAVCLSSRLLVASAIAGNSSYSCKLIVLLMRFVHLVHLVHLMRAYAFCSPCIGGSGGGFPVFFQAVKLCGYLQVRYFLSSAQRAERWIEPRLYLICACGSPRFVRMAHTFYLQTWLNALEAEEQFITTSSAPTSTVTQHAAATTFMSEPPIEREVSIDHLIAPECRLVDSHTSRELAGIAILEHEGSLIVIPCDSLTEAHRHELAAVSSGPFCPGHFVVLNGVHRVVSERNPKRQFHVHIYQPKSDWTVDQMSRRARDSDQSRHDGVVDLLWRIHLRLKSSRPALMKWEPNAGMQIPLSVLKRVLEEMKPNKEMPTAERLLRPIRLLTWISFQKMKEHEGFLTRLGVTQLTAMANMAFQALPFLNIHAERFRNTAEWEDKFTLAFSAVCGGLSPYTVSRMANQLKELSSGDWLHPAGDPVAVLEKPPAPPSKIPPPEPLTRPMTLEPFFPIRTVPLGMPERNANEEARKTSVDRVPEALHRPDVQMASGEVAKRACE